MDWLRTLPGRTVYAAILWIVAFSTLEQFQGLNTDAQWLSTWGFHGLACGLALVSAIYEAATLDGLEGLRNLWNRPDPIADVATRGCVFEFALTDELDDVRRLAKKRYGWALPKLALRRWHQANPKCLLLMRSNGELVGYFDAFPISAADYAALLTHGAPAERTITPLKADAVDATCSFYIASVVMDTEWGGRLRELLKKGIGAYSRAYPVKTWERVCAVGYSPQGRRLLEQKGASQVPNARVEEPMYVVDRRVLAGMSPANRQIWAQLLP